VGVHDASRLADGPPTPNGRPVPEYQGWPFGIRVRAISDQDESSSVYEGDEGWLGFEECGSAERGNLRVQPVLYMDEYDGGNDVSLDNLEIVDA
jgi:hypothetical protein